MLLHFFCSLPDSITRIASWSLYVHVEPHNTIIHNSMTILLAG